MGLTLILEVQNIIIYNLCRYNKYVKLSMYKLKSLFLWHVYMLYKFNCTHNHMVQKLYNTKFVVVNMTEIIANNNQLHASCIVTGCKWHDF